MSYQVLARKWRPRNFGTLIGQEHVVRALSHALATGRLHHAWLFTGTRGVGKTTISRILAKALNCETGVTAEPCGVCAACQAIDADRFPDYVEMDAASNRGVEDMAALLDKAVYAPVQGRYKVYMIDEVHMLTGHAFNAMLKTLEEPPEHVKFILATTDPQKIPVTVLSRCLQFNLKQMPPGHIVDHLARILQAEAVPFEAPALRHIAKAAAGSMRDALSLLDQAIAHGAGKVEEEQVVHMLGTVGDDHLYGALDALVAGDVAALLAVADGMEARSLSFDAALQALASLLHRLALLQFAPAAIADEGERARLAPYAEAFDAEFLQLAYQIAIHGRDELPLAPDEYAGFSMTLLRLFAFRPEHPAALGGGGESGGGAGQARSLPAWHGSEVPPPAMPAGQAAGAEKRVVAAATAPGEVSPAVPPRPSAIESRKQEAAAPSDQGVPPWVDLPPEAFSAERREDAAPAEGPGEPGEPARVPRRAAAEIGEAGSPSTSTGIDSAAEKRGREAFTKGDWHAILGELRLGGMVRELAQHCEWTGFADGVLSLRLSETHRHLLEMNRAAAERLEDAVAKLYGRPLRLKIETGAISGETPAQRDEAERRARHAEAVASLERDPFVRELIERFDATLLEASVKPI